MSEQKSCVEKINFKELEALSNEVRELLKEKKGPLLAPALITVILLESTDHYCPECLKTLMSLALERYEQTYGSIKVIQDLLKVIDGPVN